MSKNRSIEALRNQFGGTIYVILKGNNIEDRFFTDAENEGYRFGDLHPLENPRSNVISIEENKQLAYVGAVGKIRIMCDRSSDFHMIDYAKYINGDNDYLYHYNPGQKP